MRSPQSAQTRHSRFKLPDRKVLFYLVSYPSAIVVGIWFWFLRYFDVVRIHRRERFPIQGENLIIACNHPSLLDPFLIAPLFFPDYMATPWKWVPWIVADQGNFYEPWYFFWIRPRLIPVYRGTDHSARVSQVTAFRKMQEVLESGQRVIIFPEGTRTFKAELKGAVYHSRAGKTLGALEPGVIAAALRCGSSIVPVWIDESDKVLPAGSVVPRFWKDPIRITIGEPLTFTGHVTPQEATEKLAESLLQLADRMN